VEAWPIPASCPGLPIAVSFVRSGGREAVAVTETQTESKLLSEPKLLYFYSPTSGPSRRVEAFLDQVLQERNNHEAFTRGRIDVDRAPRLAEHFEVEALPTIVVLEDGRIACKVEGRVSVGSIRDALSPWLN
jgi:thioredoxin-like negative regulator of GroEL